MRKAKVTKTSKTTMSVDQKLQAIGLRRRKGDVKMIAAKTGYEQSHVSRVLSGERNNPSIVNVAYSYVSKRKAVA